MFLDVARSAIGPRLSKYACKFFSAQKCCFQICSYGWSPSANSPFIIISSGFVVLLLTFWGGGVFKYTLHRTFYLIGFGCSFYAIPFLENRRSGAIYVPKVVSKLEILLRNMQLWLISICIFTHQNNFISFIIVFQWNISTFFTATSNQSDTKCICHLSICLLQLHTTALLISLTLHAPTLFPFRVIGEVGQYTSQKYFPIQKCCNAMCSCAWSPFAYSLNRIMEK